MRIPKTLLLLLAGTVGMQAQTFVEREGTHLKVEGKVFRYSGPNLEWLGLEGYGPHDPNGPRLPSHFEIEDGFATAAEMGATVVRSQTMGDTVGCAQCIEPELGKFNDAAFEASDYALAMAAKHHMRVIVTLIGDCATCAGGGIGQYVAWLHEADAQKFFTDPKMIAAFERHVDAVLQHRNRYTGIVYKDDPAVMAWENCNMCGLIAMLGHGRVAEVAAWSETIGQHVKAMDRRHLFLDTSGIFPVYPKIVENASTDLVAFEEYPHWNAAFSVPAGLPPTSVAVIEQHAAMVTGRGKVFVLNEYGWDRTNWATQAEFQGLLDAMLRDPNISGDGFWALQAHAENFGFQAIPADSKDAKFAVTGECGEWWALYYPGVKTLAMSAEDMAARAQLLRAHAYAMSGVVVPKHAVPPAPEITTVAVGGLVAWRGSAGATRYSIERYDAAAKTWTMVCDKCATDAEDPWADPAGGIGGRYRVTAFNADGVASAVSRER